MALRIDHIGSTSVPGLAAKDLIDVQVAEVAGCEDAPEYWAHTGLSRARHTHFHSDPPPLSVRTIPIDAGDPERFAPAPSYVDLRFRNS